MKESNIRFVTNTYNYGKEYTGEARNRFFDSKGDAIFFQKVMDYDALLKLKHFPKMYGSLTSNYYVANIEQLHILDPNFSSVMIHLREKDPEIEADNKIKDEEYGYSKDNDYYPLIEEIVIDDTELSYADKILGKWSLADQGLEVSESNLFGLYLKQKIKKDLSNDTIKPEDTGFQDIEDIDPYYYLYKDSAGKIMQDPEDIDKVRLYKEKYGSIFSIFSEVSQEEIICAPAEQFSFVNAGPGTGKTYTLMEKIIYMIDTLRAPPESILVLCFTNAAVNEIKARIRHYAENDGERTFINVDVRTFHSFSWLLISQANELFLGRNNYHYIYLSQLNYEKSIFEATRIIKTFGDEVFGNVSHLIVDEIQDLTNEKASLVISMAQECIKNEVGITVLGDSCQAIYDYEDDATFVLKSDRFYEHLISEFFDIGKFYKLEKNHRQADWLIRLTSPLREAILEGKKQSVRNEIARIKNEVSTMMSGSLSLKISKQRLDSLCSDGTVCLMCRTNAQVLATSTNLRKRGIKHIVNAYNEFEYLSDWIGRVFALYKKEIISIEEFEKRLKQKSKAVDYLEVWERLQDKIGSKNNVLKVEDILSAIAKSKVDDPIFRNVPQGNLIVSNIHKSKGREYDTVVLERKFVNRLVNDVERFESVPKYIEEAKILYVALTRPRTKLYINNLATTDVSLKKIKTGRKRLARGDGRYLMRVEVRALSDVDRMSYNDPEVQKYIQNNVREGDEINLVLDISLRYNVVHVSGQGERIIGITSKEFLEDIDAITSPYNSPWPKRITDLYVSGIHTHIAANYRSVWCWVDFCGLGMAFSDAF